MAFDAVVVEAVRVMTGMASGAASAVGSSVGQMVTDMVRRRISGTPDGQAALTDLDERPADPGTAARLEEALQPHVAADPAFRSQLEAAVRGPQPSVNNGIQIGAGAKLRGNTISLGPVTIQNTPAARATLVTLAVVLVVALVFGVYGVSRAIRGDDSPSRTEPGAAGRAPGPEDEPAARSTGGDGTASEDTDTPAADVRPLGAEEIDHVLSSLEMPFGWTHGGWATESAEGMNLTNIARQQCWDLDDPDPYEHHGPGKITDSGAGGEGVAIDLTAVEASGTRTATADAVDSMAALRIMYGCLPDAGPVDIGDEAFTCTQPGYVYTWVRVGPMIAWVITANPARETSNAWARKLVPALREALGA